MGSPQTDGGRPRPGRRRDLHRYGVCVVRSTNGDWGACFTGHDHDGDRHQPGDGYAILNYGDVDAAMRHMETAWRDTSALDPTPCPGDHGDASSAAHRCDRTDCPIRYEAPDA